MSDLKLIQARDRIRAILDELDIAGIVFLHNAPGSFEFDNRLSPSYSKLSGVPPYIRLRSKLADYGGDTAAQMRDLAATANMVSGFGRAMAESAITMLELARIVDAKTGAEHTDWQKDD